MSPRPRAFPRALVILLASIVGLLLLYLVAANVLLSGRILRSKLQKGPNRTFIDWTSARSVWPGRVQVRGLRIRDRDLSAEWMLELDEARFSYSLPALLQRRFEARAVRGRGLIFRARNRLEKGKASPERLRYLPPIFGFPDPPLLEAGQKRPPRTGKELDVRVSDLVVEDLREIWVDGTRWEGDARVTGGFFLRPKLRAEVFRSALEIERGRLGVSGAKIFDPVKGSLAAAVRPWESRRFPGSQMLRFVEGEAKVSARAAEVTSLDRLLGGFGQLRVTRGRPTTRLEAQVRRGLAAGSVTLEEPDFGARVVDFELAGRLSAKIQFRDYDLARGSGHLTGSYAELRDVSVEDAGRKEEPWWGRVELSSGTVRLQPAAEIRGTTRLRARDARPLLAILKVNLPRWVEKLFDLEGVAANAGVRLGPSLLSVTGLDARVGDYHLQGDYHARGRAKRAVFLIDLGPLSVGIGLRDGVREVEIVGARGWFEKETGREPLEGVK